MNDCEYDHEHGPCVDCGAVGPVGWAHTCFPCFETRLRVGMGWTMDAGIARVRAAAEEVYAPEGVDIWMNAPNPSLNGATPMQMIAAGDTDRVLQVLDQLASGAFG